MYESIDPNIVFRENGYKNECVIPCHCCSCGLRAEHEENGLLVRMQLFVTRVS